MDHGHVVLLPSMTAFFVVLILGIIAVAISIVKENGPSGSSFWFFTAFWATCLAFLI